MTETLAAGLIFAMRVLDVSLGTLRVLYTVQGRRACAAALGFVEALVYIAAISHMFKNVGNWPEMVGYAAGFAAGTALGVTIESVIATGYLTLRIISREHSEAVLTALRAADFGVTSVRGEGRQGERLVLFLVTSRRRSREAWNLVHSIDPAAFVTADVVSFHGGGYLPPAHRVA